MAITYHAGRRIQGLAYTASSSLFSDDFSTDKGWSFNDATDNVSGGVLNHRIGADGSNNSLVYDLGVGVVESTWILRCKYHVTTSVNSNQSGHHFGLCDKDETFEIDDAGQSYVGTRIWDQSGSNGFNARIQNNGTPEAASAGSTASHTWTSGTDQWFEIIKTTTDVTVNLFTNANYTGTPAQTSTYTGTHTGAQLRYIKLMNSATWNGGTHTGYLDDLEFHNGVTSVVVEAGDAKPTNVPDYTRFEETDTRKMYSYLPPPAVTFEDDFSSYASQASADASWITNATNVRVNILTDKLGFAWTAGTPNQQCYYDLGASVSETEWVLRFVVNYSTLTSASAHLPVADIKMSGSSSSANYPLAASQISFQLSAGSGSANVYFKSTNTSGSGEVSPTAIAWNPTTGTDYYVEMIRTSATHATLNVRTGSHSGTMVTNFPMNLTSINSGCTGLRYLRLQQYPNSFGNITGTLGDVKFYNGVTSVVTTNSWKEKGTT